MKILVILFVIVVLFTGISAYFQHTRRSMTPREPNPARPTSLSPGTKEFVTATLYFPNLEATGLVSFPAKILDTRSNLVEWVSSLIEGLSSQNVEGAAVLFPPETHPRSVFLSEDGTLYIDLPRDQVTSATAGVEFEVLAVGALIKSLVSNVDGAKRVKILIEGTDSETFWGHTYIHKALEAR